MKPWSLNPLGVAIVPQNSARRNEKKEPDKIFIEL